MYEIREQIYVAEIVPHIPVAIGADIGGTNANIGIFDLRNPEKPILIFSLHGKSQYIENFTDFIIQIMNRIEKKELYPTAACFGVAGVISANSRQCKPTNASFLVDVEQICAHTHLKACCLVNDFQIIGYGLSYIEQNTIVQVNNGVAWKHANQAILGAGTGLGKSIMHWHSEKGRYEPVVSEGGHADLAVQSQLELDLIDFIHDAEQKNGNISWEDVLSGNGIRRLFAFFCARNIQQLDGYEKAPHPDEIFQSRTDNICAASTYELFARFYARCAKNFCLDALALGGVYIAGGIAAKNIQLFQEPAFMQEFINCGKHEELLRNVPIYVITDYNVSLYGAIACLLVKTL